MTSYVYSVEKKSWEFWRIRHTFIKRGKSSVPMNTNGPEDNLKLLTKAKLFEMSRYAHSIENKRLVLENSGELFIQF